MKLEEWKKKIAERNDITGHLIHLTKEREIEDKKISSIEILVKILKEKKLIGSTTESGFIVGDKSAVCFQESPIYSLAQNVYYEQKLFKDKKLKKMRYVGVGLMFNKTYIYKKGGRPVIYDKTTEAKKYLPKDQWWRIVNYDLSDENNIIDWTHEREWRVAENLEFELSDISVIVSNYKMFKKIIKECNNVEIDLVNEVKSIINLGDLFFSKYSY
ncbi:DUF2971 domain-containing protein [Clostridium perfringens]|uniref:DUF2971 domain-containing protein n=1 Tax=Clostridium perfringens TaxID=1502 RepID=UPI0024BD3B98|nr:DUF2971 domain-containing protein [Clostridium perfringens]